MDRSNIPDRPWPLDGSSQVNPWASLGHGSRRAQPWPWPADRAGEPPWRFAHGWGKVGGLPVLGMVWTNETRSPHSIDRGIMTNGRGSLGVRMGFL